MTEAGECEPNPPAEEFFLDLTPAIEEDDGSPQTMEPVYIKHQEKSPYILLSSRVTDYSAICLAFS